MKADVQTLGNLNLIPLNDAYFNTTVPSLPNGNYSTGGTKTQTFNTIANLSAKVLDLFQSRTQPNYQQQQTSYPGQISSNAGASVGQTAGAAVGGIGDALGKIVTEQPLLVLGAGAALLLLFMKPPSRRR